MFKLICLICVCISLNFAESLWQGENTGLFGNTNAKNVGDSITVIVTEKIESTQKSDSKLDNSNEFSFGPGKGYGKFVKDVTSFPNKSSFKANGTQSSAGELKTEVTVLIVAKNDNGELVISGDRITDINGEKQMIKITGIVRPDNIMKGNKVYSTALANAKISYYHVGEIKNVVEPGLITKLFNTVF